MAGLDPAIVDGTGVIPPSAVPEYVRAIRREVTDRGPGPHILTGPVFVNGALPGDVLEVRIQQIDLAVDYGNNVQRPYAGALPDEFTGFFQRIIPIDRQAKTAILAPDVVVPVHSWGELFISIPRSSMTNRLSDARAGKAVVSRREYSRHDSP